MAERVVKKEVDNILKPWLDSGVDFEIKIKSLPPHLKACYKESQKFQKELTCYVYGCPQEAVYDIIGEYPMPHGWKFIAVPKQFKKTKDILAIVEHRGKLCSQEVHFMLKYEKESPFLHTLYMRILTHAIDPLAHGTSFYIGKQNYQGLVYRSDDPDISIAKKLRNYPLVAVAIAEHYSTKTKKRNK